MKSVRPYREKAMNHREVLRELDLQAGLQFDPELVEIFKGLYPDLKEELH
jgi:response regulator RpfG family c-di-GMP phosphodiesterase